VNTSRNYFILYLIGIIILFFTLLRIILAFTFNNSYPELFLGSSLLITLSALLIRLIIVDMERAHLKLKGFPYQRFLNFMPLTMVSCSLADFLIREDFIVGMLTFLVAQMLYIFSYSGILNVWSPRSWFEGKKRIHSCIILIFWIIFPSFMYIFLLFNPSDFVTLAIIPYIILLCFMVFLTNLHFIKFPERKFIFRLLLAWGGIMFFISDAILAINRFTYAIGTPLDTILIGTTYIIAVGCLHYSILFLFNNKNE